jgi:hypothetical protein
VGRIVPISYALFALEMGKAGTQLAEFRCHYGSAYETTKRRANTLVAGKLLPETMKAASRATIQ